MVSIKRASKSERTSLKHNSPKINRLRDTEGKKLLNQEVVSVSDDLSVCVLNILPKVSSLLPLLAINLVKGEIQSFKQSCALMLVT